jgi:hypothetical protein
LRYRISSNSGALAETAAVFRENDLLYKAGPFPGRRSRFLVHIASRPSGQAECHIGVRILSPGQAGFEFRCVSAAPRYAAVQCLVRSGNKCAADGSGTALTPAAAHLAVVGRIVSTGKVDRLQGREDHASPSVTGSRCLRLTRGIVARSRTPGNHGA